MIVKLKGIGRAESRVCILDLLDIRRLAALSDDKCLRRVGAENIRRREPIFTVGNEMIVAIRPQIRCGRGVEPHACVVYRTVVDDALDTVREKSYEHTNVLAERVTADDDIVFVNKRIFLYPTEHTELIECGQPHKISADACHLDRNRVRGRAAVARFELAKGEVIADYRNIALFDVVYSHSVMLGEGKLALAVEVRLVGECLL